jgi:tetratricopeptide (TPR) repeat protein
LSAQTPPDVQTPTPSPEIPRAPAIEFIARRDKEGRDILEQLKEKLAPHNHQLIVLWGPGGVGKTRLANEAAHTLREAFANRIVWVSADGRPDFNLSTLLDGIAAQLDRAELRQLAPEPKKEQVRELIASAPPLIILDNFETIAPQEQKQCASFLAQDASCPALITTRAMIASNSANNIPIDAMAQDEAQKFLDKLIAQAHDTEAFTATNRQRIIQTSAANPLVMQWVVQQIILAQEPQAVLDKLSHGEGDAAQRVFDNSFELPHVGDDGRAALLALSLFTPSASRPALAEVAGFGGDVERLNQATTSLGALRLVRTTEEGKRLLIEGLTRELAKARLSKDARSAEFGQRFVTYFLNCAEAHVHPTPDDFDALEAEKDNLMGAMDEAFTLSDWASVMELMSAIDYDGVNGFLTVRGYWDEAIRRGEQASKAARMLSDQRQIARFIHNLAIIYQFRGELGEARRLYYESLEIKKKLGDQTGIAATLHELGRLAQAQGELEDARRLYDESLEIKKKLGNQRGIAITLHALATLMHSQGDLTEARRLYNESLEITEKLSDKGNIALIFSNMGLLAEKEGNREEAVRLMREALGILEKLKSPYAEKAQRHLKRLEMEES